MPTAAVSIGKVTARCRGEADALVTRLRIDRLLQTVDYAPPGFTPQAVLLVRRLVVHRTLCLSGVRPDALWERGTRDALMRLFRRAVRPRDGRIPGGADVLLFSDMAELLACLGLVLRDISSDDWYRQAMLQHAGGPTSFAQALLASPRQIPAVVTRLARWGQAARLLDSMTLAEVDALCAELVSELGLPSSTFSPPKVELSPLSGRPGEETGPPSTRIGSLRPKKSRASAAEGREDTGECESGSEAGRTPGFAPGDRRLLDPPWLRWLEHPGDDWRKLDPVRQDLLGVCLTLCHAPRQARRGTFSNELRDWRNPARRLLPTTVVAESSNYSAPAPRESETQTPVRMRPEPSKGIRFDAEPAQGPHQPVSAEVPQASPGRIEKAGTRALSTDAWPWKGVASIETHRAGVLYLLNLCTQLDLPDCFSAEGLPNHISGWGLAETLGRSLLLDGGYEVSDADPLWQLLARLDGRAQNELPAAHWKGSSDYRLPDAWSGMMKRTPRLQSPAPAVAYWSTLPDAFSHWLRWSFPLMRQLLRQALGDTEMGSAELCRVLLLTTGRVYFTATHVDLVTRLDQISLPVRRAGLDANPGWVRDLMRVVAFHFL